LWQRSAVSGANVSLFAELAAQAASELGIDLDCGKPTAAFEQPARSHAVPRPDLKHVAV
jgi:hypothetical protein